MSDVAKRLHERRNNVWSQAMELANRAAEENREFTAEEQGQWDALNEDIQGLDQRINSALETEERNKATEEKFARIDGKSTGRGGKESQQASELRSWMRGEGPRFFDVQPDGPVSYRTLTTGVGAEGGDTVPTGFYDRLVAHLIETAAIMQAGVTVIRTSGGDNIQVPKTTAHSSAVIVTEGSAITASDPGFGQITLGAYKYGTLVQVSRELLDDSGVDLEGYMAMQTGRALGNAFGAHAITGTGSSQPRGVVTDATEGVTGGSAAAPTYEDLVDLHYSVIAPYRQSRACHWLMNDATVGEVRKLRDESGGAGTGQPLWQQSLVVGAPDTIFGKPVLTDPNVDTIGAGNKSVLFGDFSQFFVRMAGGIRFERSDDFAFSSDLTTFRALMRADAALVDLTGAVKYYASA